MAKEEARKRALAVREHRKENFKESGVFRKLEAFIEESINDGFTGCIYKVSKGEVDDMDIKLMKELLITLGYKVSIKDTFVRGNTWQEKAISISWK